MKVPFAIYYGAMILLVWAGARASCTRRQALLFALLAATAPAITQMSSLGMGDLPMAVIFLAAVICIERWNGSPEALGWILTAGLLTALLAWTKREGTTLALLVLAVSALRAASLTGVPLAAKIRHGCGMVTLMLLPLAPWWIWLHKLELRDWVLNAETMAPSNLFSKLRLLPAIVSRMSEFLFTDSGLDTPAWNAAYIMLLALLLLHFRRFRHRACWLLALTLLAGLCGYGLIYVVSPMGLRHLERSLCRILIHFYPLAVVLIARVYAQRGDAAAVPSNPASERPSKA